VLCHPSTLYVVMVGAALAQDEDIKNATSEHYFSP